MKKFLRTDAFIAAVVCFLNLTEYDQSFNMATFAGCHIGWDLKYYVNFEGSR